MTDRELLEKAAKAAGLYFDAWSDRITDHDSPHLWGAALHRSGPGGECNSWNPLRDDGDAFQLAVRLKLLVDCCSRCAMPLQDDIGWLYGDLNDDAAATRRAIVRAAAALCKEGQPA